MFRGFKENIYFYLSILAILLLFLIVEYSLISKGFFALSADESGHTLEAYEWYKGEGKLFSIWLPFHKIVNGMALKIHYDLLVTPRVTSGFFGLLTLISLIFLTHQLFENKIVDILAGFFAAIFVPIAVFSVLPLIEIYFFFFVVSSIACYLFWLKYDRKIFLWLTLAFLIIGTTTRYEAWIFAAFLSVMIVYHILKSNRSTSNKTILTVSILLLVSAFPLYWIYLSAGVNENVHGFVSSVTNRYHEGQTLSEVKNNAFYLFLNFNFNSLNIIGLAVLIYLIKINSNVKKYAIIFFGTLLTFSILSFVIKAMPTHNYWRIAMIWSLMLVPFTVNWLFSLLETSNSSPINRYIFIIFFVLLLYFFNAQTEKYTAYSYFDREEVRIGEYLNEITKDNSSKIYVMKDASDKWRYTNLVVASQKPDQFVTTLKNFSYVTSDTITVEHMLFSEMLKQKIGYVLMPSKTVISNGSEYFNQVKNFNHWKVFKMAHAIFNN